MKQQQKCWLKLRSVEGRVSFNSRLPARYQLLCVCVCEFEEVDRSILQLSIWITREMQIYFKNQNLPIILLFYSILWQSVVRLQIEGLTGKNELHALPMALYTLHTVYGNQKIWRNQRLQWVKPKMCGKRAVCQLNSGMDVGISLQLYKFRNVQQ